MLPVLIVRHTATEGAGYFSEFLDQHAIPWQLLRIDAGEALPAKLNGYSGLCLMGGPMSVNDDLPWIAPELALIREAVVQQWPVIGHCLGGQLLSKAMGGTVSANPVKEIGWGEVRVTDPSAAAEWVGDAQSLWVFHWHGETFSIPPGGTRILDSAYCSNQAFLLDDRHIGMQCHIEMTPRMIENWCASGADEIANSPNPAVQSPEVMQADLEVQTQLLHRIADKIYSRWIQGLQQ
ncbi:MAG: type 1 glutamine amidotransferase [Thiobacillus sp.]